GVPHRQARGCRVAVSRPGPARFCQNTFAQRGFGLTVAGMRIGLAQINTTAGDLRGNNDRILTAYDALLKQGVDLVVFPELAVAGYPPRDLLFKSRFISDNEAALRAIAETVGDVPALVGFVEANHGRGQPAFNALAWCETGAVRRVARKCLLPTYDVFDEERYFEPAREPIAFEWRGHRIGMTICEDLWNHPEVPTARYYEIDPVAMLAKRGIDVLINASASPWHYRKDVFRRNLLADAAKRCDCPVVYCNLVGGNDELIFDGNSLVIGADGQIIHRLDAFAEACAVVEIAEQSRALPRSKPNVGGGLSGAGSRPLSEGGGQSPSAPHLQMDPISPADADMERVAGALTLGLRDYVHKSGFSKAVIGLSGGIDSAVTCALAVRALGAENVTGVSLPSQISSEHSKADATELAHNLGIRFETLPVHRLVEAEEATLAHLFAGTEPGVTEENLQARSRGILLMALSNKFGWILLSTGNKSEMAVGYCTLYGDMAGGLAVLSDVPKTMVFELAKWLNRDAGSDLIPQNTIEKPPSAELRPDQKDEDSLPPYPILDEILRRYIEERQSRAEIIEASDFDAETVNEVCRKVDLNEYKRKQAPPGFKITPLAFGTGRRIPIVQKYIG
ncbi:MAG: NAD+ synthase, partial [Opitutales bacterium]